MPTINIRWADNTKQLAQNLKEGLNQIESTKAAAEKMAQALGGQNLIRAAHNYVAAVQQLGGAQKLTASEQARVNETLTKAIEKYKALGKDAPAAMRELAEATKQAEAPTGGLTTKIVALGAAIGTFLGNLAYDAVKRIGSGLLEIASNGIKLAPTVGAFNRLTAAVGETSDAMLRAGRTATKGLISDLDLMQAANKGLLLGLPITSQSFGTLAQTAVVLGKAMGQGPVKSFDDLITALGRSSPMILDNLGLSVRVEEANNRYAASIGKTADELTDAEKKLAFYNAAMDAAREKVAQLGGLNLTLADRVTQVKAAFKNFTDALGVAIATSPVINAAFGHVGDAIQSAFGENQTVLVQRLIKIVNGIAIGMADVAQAGLTGASILHRAWAGVELLFSGMGSLISLVALAFGNLVEGALAVASKVPGLSESMGGLRDKMTAFNAVTRQTQKTFHDYAAGAWENVKGNGAFEQTLGTLGTSIAGMRAKMVEASKTNADAAVIAGHLAKKHDDFSVLTGKAKTAAEQFAESMRELGSATGDYQAIIDMIDGNVVEAIRFYLAAGVAQADLARAYALTATQVKAVATALDAEEKALKAATKAAIEKAKFNETVAKEQADALKPMSEAVLANLKQQTAAERDLRLARSAAIETALERDLFAVDEWVRQEKAKLDKRPGNHAVAERAIIALAEERRRELRRLAEIENVKLQFTFVGPERAGANPIDTVAERVKSQLGAAFRGLPDLITKAFVSGGGFGGAIKGFASQIGSIFTGGWAESIQKKLPGKLGEVLGSIVGPLGSAVGPLLGKIGDALTVSAGEDVKRRVGRNWGIAISEAMGDQIAKDAKNLFGGSRQAAELFNMKGIFAADQNNLGITKRNVEQAAKALHDVFSMIATGQMTIAQGAKVIDENWTDLVEAGTDSFGFVSDSIKELIALDKQYGTQSKEIAEFLKQQADVAVSASNAVIDSVQPLVKAWQDVHARVEAANKAWDEARKRGDMSAMVKADKEWAAAQKELTALAKAHKQELEDLGQIALATFASAMAAGKSYAEALEAAGPGLQTLVDGFKALQIETDNAALKVLMLQASVLQRNPALVKGVASLGQAFAALSNMGMLNVDTFGAMTRTGAQMYQRLQAEVAAVGGTTKDALLPMQDYLHKAQKAAEELGIPLDDNTQMLIDQSKELGIWKDTGKSATDKLIDGMTTLVDKVDKLVKALLGIPDTDYTVTENRVVDWHVEPPPNFEQPEISYGARGGRVTPSGIQYFVDGGPVMRVPQFQPIGLDTVPAMLRPGELVLTPEHQRVVGDLLAKSSGSSAQGAASISVSFGDIRIEATGADLQDIEAFAPKFNEGVRRNAGGMLTVIETVAKRAVGGS